MIVSILEKQNQAALVEWSDALGQHRAIVPQDKIGKQGDIDVQELEYGIPYGVPWETLAMVTVTPHILARLLRARGIWTEDDLRRNIPQVHATFQEAFSIDLKNLIDSVRQAREGGN